MPIAENPYQPPKSSMGAANTSRILTNGRGIYLALHILLSAFTICLVHNEQFHWNVVFKYLADLGIVTAFPLFLLGCFHCLKAYFTQQRPKFYFWAVDMCVSLTTLVLIFPAIC